jgi:arsenate reductase
VTVTIYHDPDCATSRNVLALIRNSGEEPRVVEYLHAPPSREELVELLRRMDLPLRDVLRRKGRPTTSSASTTRSGTTTGSSSSC